MAPPAPPREVELKLALDREWVPEVLHHECVVAARRGRVRTTRLVSTYYDTAGGALARAGVALRIRRDSKRYIQTVKGPADGASAPPLSARPEYEWPLRRPAIDVASLAATPWASLFRRAVDEGLVRRFTTDFVRREVPLALPGGTRALLCVDTGEIRAPATRRRLPISELEIELVDGSHGPLFEFARSLGTAVPISILLASKAERGTALATGAPDRAVPVRADSITLADDASAIAALAAIARQCLHQVTANAPGLLAGTDPEWVHQLRVGTRRLRACLKLVARVDETAPVEPLAAELKWLAGVLGTARDLDVLATQTLPAIEDASGAHTAAKTSLALLARRIGARRRIARRDARAAVASSRYTQLVLAAGELAAGLDDRAHCVPLAAAAVELLARRHRVLHRRAGAFANGTADERHAARIAAKKLRYAAEFFAPLYPRKRVRRYLHTLTDLQQVLGFGNDARIASRLAAESGPEIAALAVRAYEAAQLQAQASALRKTWKRFERTKPFWKRD